VDADSLGRDTLGPPGAQARAGAQGSGKLRQVELWPGVQRLSPGSFQRETWHKDAEEIQARAQGGGRRDAASTSTYVEKTGPLNFLPCANLGTMGQQNDPPLMSELTVSGIPYYYEWSKMHAKMGRRIIYFKMK
jgi:hypothetical protein